MDNDQEIFLINPSGEPLSLEEAKKSSEWKEWEEAIKVELDQLTTMGTWKLVDKPKDALPISNKWHQEILEILIRHYEPPKCIVDGRLPYELVTIL